MSFDELLFFGVVSEFGVFGVTFVDGMCREECFVVGCGEVRWV